ncbi:hypothetical protein UFOVP1244_112 [uncultured Caudovirales phage]|uniref:Uncharacterized protein n=1 Tax=uncultured Caudovirales phage TaxID=2100421 RepID=A0A6J5RH17_9CAUD|nr:hypothetical protein UFOVP1244_112 [uncultured Caudovirales phage]
MFEQDTICEWEPGVDGRVHKVKVCGICGNGSSGLLGRTFIVELAEPIEGWPYTHAAAFERNLRPSAVFPEGAKEHDLWYAYGK